MCPKQPKRPHQTAEQGWADLQSPRKRCRATGVSNENLAIINEGFNKQTDLNFAVNLVQQERVHMAERSEASTRQESGGERQPASIDSLPKLYKPDLPTNASPQERLCAISPTTEPFSLHAREGMRVCGLNEGSMEDLELRKAACCDMWANEPKRPPGSSWSVGVEVSETEADSDVFRDLDGDIDDMELARDAEISRPPRPPRRDTTDTIRGRNPAKMRSNGALARKKRA